MSIVRTVVLNCDGPLCREHLVGDTADTVRSKAERNGWSIAQNSTHDFCSSVCGNRYADLVAGRVPTWQVPTSERYHRNVPGKPVPKWDQR